MRSENAENPTLSRSHDHTLLGQSKNPLTRAFFSQGDAKDMWPPHALWINNNPDFGGGNHITLHYIQYDILSLLDFELILKNTPVRN